ncbi:MAG: enoyl-CoA hydratase/isomerase family protein [Deltaproteobacteria bacterium]|nr:enoyl-CoA hydratase/isomerase family protein [Deltaproteobacteria bacterium]MBW2051465.1 enoyl-CoA hydratase/isomerase family protein [Deltaproteobacteria bacterium]MBW2140575.1 enoyl-CoA hydratase/isomerase family protein [Deltaproteobacteria bacterium]MBW2323259.1 enoyl-CoA hydratase/isomerase family protein [Deltaproteobacteria bacterium]
MRYEELIYSVEDGNIAVITLNRPHAMNALTHQTHAELGHAIGEANLDEKIRVIIITGTGRGFCAGDDVKNIFLGEGPGGGTAGGNAAQRYRETQLGYLQGQKMVGGGEQLLHINKPTIAAVNGAAVGYGCDLALMCDMRIASEKARFGEVFLRVGLMPDEAQLILPRLVGLAKAYELMLTTDIIDAQEAEKIGLVNRTVPHDELMDSALELARKIASKPPISVRLAKEGIRRGLNMPLDEWKQWYSFAMSYCFSTEDHHEGATAFVEKREPVFKGK